MCLNNIDNLKQIFADTLSELYNIFKQDRRKGIDLIATLAKKNPVFWDYSKIDDIDLNSAISYSDTFFDAAWHGSDKIIGMPMDEAELLIISIINTLQSNNKIDDERILKCYHHKTKT